MKITIRTLYGGNNWCSRRKRVSIFGVASQCITSGMLQTLKKQIISAMTCMTFSQFLSFFMNVDIIYIYGTSS